MGCVFAGTILRTYPHLPVNDKSPSLLRLVGPKGWGLASGGELGPETNQYHVHGYGDALLVFHQYPVNSMFVTGITAGTTAPGGVQSS